jgi:hypothetical protein
MSGWPGSWLPAAAVRDVLQLDGLRALLVLYAHAE